MLRDEEEPYVRERARDYAEGIFDALVRTIGSTPDEVGALLRAHLWCEQALNNILFELFTEDTPLDIGRMPFSAKVDVLLGLGQLDCELVESLRRLNRLRNEVAHKFGREPSEDDQSRLWASLPSEVREEAQSIGGDGAGDFPDGFRRIVMWIALQTEMAVHVVPERRQAAHDKWRRQQKQDGADVDDYLRRFPSWSVITREA